MMPIVVSPGRFRTKRQFWSYCGLGIVMHSSSDWVPKKDGGGWMRADVQKTRGLSLSHNHTLKNIFKGAATTVIALLGESEPLHQDYQRLTAAGTKPNLAKLTIARKIAAIVLSMWKSKEKYDSTKHRKQSQRLVSRVDATIPQRSMMDGAVLVDEHGSRVSIHTHVGPGTHSLRSLHKAMPPRSSKRSNGQKRSS
jgi:hypothetical protein